MFKKKSLLSSILEPVRQLILQMWLVKEEKV